MNGIVFPNISARSLAVQQPQRSSTLQKQSARYVCRCVLAQTNPEAEQQHQETLRSNQEVNNKSQLQRKSVQTVRDQLQRLQQAEQESQQALQQAQISNNVNAQPGGTVDVRMYDQMRSSRNRLSSKLSEAKKYISYLESTRQQSYEDVSNAYEVVCQLCCEFGGLADALESVAGSALYGLDQKEALQKLDACVERFQNMETFAQQYQEQMRDQVPRKVSVRWAGVASEVRVMGDFDNWTMGQELSREDGPEGNDHVFCTFQTNLTLLPGTYRIKLLVDGKWRLAPDWPSEMDQGTKETNNVITVE